MMTRFRAGRPTQPYCTLMYNVILVPCPRSEYLLRETLRLQHGRRVLRTLCAPGPIHGWAKQADGDIAGRWEDHESSQCSKVVLHMLMM